MSCRGGVPPPEQQMIMFIVGAGAPRPGLCAMDKGSAASPYNLTDIGSVEN